MLDDRLLHLARRDPHAGALEKIVAAPLEPVEALLVAAIDVAGLHPAVADQLGGLLGLVKVVGNRAAALDMQVAAPCALDRRAIVVGEPGRVAFEHHARAAWPVAAPEVVDE